jgi:alanine dehydrogenase
MLVVSDADAVRSLPYEPLMRELRAGLIAVADGSARGLPRARLHITDSAYMSLMGASDPAQGVVSKVLVSDPELRHRGLPTQQAVITLYDYDTGTVEAIINGRAVGAIRTAATAALSVLAVDRGGAPVESLAVVGGGHQALVAVQVMSEVLRPARVSFYARTAAAREHIAAACPDASPASSLAEAIEGADVISVCTRPEVPVLDATMVRPGTHVTSIGSGEIAMDLMRSALILAEAPESRLAPPVGCRELSEDPGIGMTLIGDVLSGRSPVALDPDRVVVFKSMGHAIEDLVAARIIVAAARAAGLGTEVDF